MTGYREPVSSDDEAVLFLSCWVGHHLGTLSADPNGLTLAPYTDPHVWGTTRAKDREASRQSDAHSQQADRCWESLDGTFVVAPEYVSATHPEWWVPNFGLAEYIKHAATITPDGSGLDWACMACFRSGATGAIQHHTTKPYHYGRVGLEHLARVLAAQLIYGVEAHRLVPAVRGTKQALKAIIPSGNSPRQEQARKSLARSLLANCISTPLIPEDPDYSRWCSVHRTSYEVSPFMEDRFRRGHADNDDARRWAESPTTPDL